jgi:alkyl sulfatase BDS1-like metallo-beta-lactamase superfamily hydrolase
VEENLLERSARYIDQGTADGPASTNPIDGQLSELGDDVALVRAFSHSVILDSGDGLVLFDTSLEPFGPSVVAGYRGWRPADVDSIVYTHGHVDHVGGSAAVLADATERGSRAPRVVGHENIPDRFDRYELTDGYNRIVNHRQFGAGRGGLTGGRERFSLDWIRPQVTYRDHLVHRVGDLEIELHHDLGETDDHTWAWLPHQRYLVTGDFFCWIFPNAGNPQKAQRDPLEWAAALRTMAGLGAELLLPAHGLPIAGRDRIARVLADVALALETLVADVLELMNEGATLDAILHSVAVDPSLLEKPYLQVIYDEPEFAVHNIWRLYGGWYDGNPARLKPPPDAAAAVELASLVGGVPVLTGRALELADAGDLRLACHLVELAVQAAPADVGAHRARADVYDRRRRVETSRMSKGIFAWAAAQSRGVSGSS